MPRGRQPEGEHALSDAERQARYRARLLATQSPPVVRYRRFQAIVELELDDLAAIVPPRGYGRD